MSFCGWCRWVRRLDRWLGAEADRLGDQIADEVSDLMTKEWGDR
jgi:hypothetical protein